MSTCKRIAAPAAVAALLVAVASCESTDLTADPDGELRLSANPSNVVIDEPAGETQGQATLIAQVFDESNFAMDGVSVLFIATGGSLASAASGSPVPVKTNANGVATDVLTLTLADPASVEITASSGTLSMSVTVDKTVSSGNVPPEAVIAASPTSRQIKNRAVSFSGAGSSDPDGSITCYQWTIDSTVDSRDEVIQGPTSSLVTRTYATEQVLTVTLRVSDAPDAASTFCPVTVCNPNDAGCSPAAESNFSADIDFINGYRIVCAIDPPTVNAGLDRTFVSGGQQVNATLNGSATATDAAIATYQWDCGGGLTSNPPPGQQVTCSYPPTPAGTASIVYTAELTVTDVCGLRGTDRVNITVLP